MASIAPTTLGPVDLVRASNLDTALNGAQSVQKVAAFDAAMARQSGGSQFVPVQTAQVGTTSAVAATNAATAPQATQAAQAVQASQDTDALRARRALDLDGAKASGSSPSAEGDAILQGLEGLRGQFDRSMARVNTVLGAQNVDAKTLLAVQVEVVNFTMMVDMTSKLTGKSTQTLDSLMKGQ